MFSFHSLTLSYVIMFFMRDESPSSCLALGQSGRTENSIQMLSITVATSSGGLVNTRISDMSLLSRELSAWGKREKGEGLVVAILALSYSVGSLQCRQCLIQIFLSIGSDSLSLSCLGLSYSLLLHHNSTNLNTQVTTSHFFTIVSE